MRYDQIFELICELDLLAEEFENKINIFYTKIKKFEFYLGRLSFKKLKFLSRKNLLNILRCKRFFLISLIETFEIESLLLKEKY